MWAGRFRVGVGVALIVVLSLSGTACGSASDAAHPLAGALLGEGPSAYERVDGPSGPLDTEGAVHALAYLPREEVRSALSDTGFLEGYAKVWEQPDDPRHFAVTVVLTFSEADGATEFVGFEVQELDDLPSSYPIETLEIDGGFGYTFGGDRGRTGAPTFCNLIWFVRSARAYEVRVCGPRQVGGDLVRELATRQARVART